MKKFHTRRGGFTLIELMIVVAIIGILAAIAIPNFLRFQLKAKTSEGKTNLAAIRTAEEASYSEFGIYVSAGKSPAEPGLNIKVGFTNTDGANAGFDQLGWTPEGQVDFTYGVATLVSANGCTASAGADIDNDGTPQQWGYKKQDAGADVGAIDLSKGGTCPESFLKIETVGPCAASFGQSVF